PQRIMPGRKLCQRGGRVVASVSPPRRVGAVRAGAGAGARLSVRTGSASASASALTGQVPPLPLASIIAGWRAIAGSATQANSRHSSRRILGPGAMATILRPVVAVATVHYTRGYAPRARAMRRVAAMRSGPVGARAGVDPG